MKEERDNALVMATALVDHLTSVGAEECRLPVVDRAQEYIVRVVPIATQSKEDAALEQLKADRDRLSAELSTARQQRDQWKQSDNDVRALMRLQKADFEQQLAACEKDRERAKVIANFDFHTAFIVWSEENWEMPKVQRYAVAEALTCFLHKAFDAARTPVAADKEGAQ